MQNPAANEPDYKALLEKYMRHVIRMDGESYCPESCDTEFAAGELEYLRSLSDALYAGEKVQTSQAFSVINSWSGRAMDVPADGSATTIIRDRSGKTSAFSHTSFSVGGASGGTSIPPGAKIVLPGDVDIMRRT